MTCNIANNISLETLITSWGYKKLSSHRGGDEFYFENPIREEKVSSFSINIKKNVWIDFIDMKGGKVIDLIMVRENTDVKGALNWLRNNTNNIDVSEIKKTIESDAYEKPPARFRFRNSKEIFSYGLKDYLNERGIDLNIAKTHVREIRYYDEVKKKEFFSLGIKNNSGGYNLRNKIRKVILSPNDITYIASHASTNTILIFEGLFDFLSYLMIKKTSVVNDDVIILNTLAFSQRAVDFIITLPHIEIIHSYLDNPKEDNVKSQEAMDRALQVFVDSKKSLLIANETFKGFDDLSQYWMKEKKCVEPVLRRLY